MKAHTTNVKEGTEARIHRREAPTLSSARGRSGRPCSPGLQHRPRPPAPGPSPHTCSRVALPATQMSAKTSVLGESTQNHSTLQPWSQELKGVDEKYPSIISTKERRHGYEKFSILRNTGPQHKLKILSMLMTPHKRHSSILLPWTSLVAQTVKNPPAMWETWV